MYWIKEQINKGLPLARLDNDTQQDIETVKYLSNGFTQEDADARMLDSAMRDALADEFAELLQKEEKKAAPKKPTQAEIDVVLYAGGKKKPKAIPKEYPLPKVVKQFMPINQQEFHNEMYQELLERFQHEEDPAAAAAEEDEFRNTIKRLEQEIEAIPPLYAQDGKGMEAIVHAHFFVGGSDWWITEYDSTENLAFGYVVLNGDVQMSELGQISIEELKHINLVNLDYHWDKKPLGKILNKKYPKYFDKPNEVITSDIELTNTPTKEEEHSITPQEIELKQEYTESEKKQYIADYRKIADKGDAREIAATIDSLHTFADHFFEKTNFKQVDFYAAVLLGVFEIGYSYKKDRTPDEYVLRYEESLKSEQELEKQQPESAYRFEIVKDKNEKTGKDFWLVKLATDEKLPYSEFKAIQSQIYELGGSKYYKRKKGFPFYQDEKPDLSGIGKETTGTPTAKKAEKVPTIKQGTVVRNTNAMRYVVDNAENIQYKRSDADGIYPDQKETYTREQLKAFIDENRDWKLYHGGTGKFSIGRYWMSVKFEVPALMPKTIETSDKQEAVNERKPQEEPLKAVYLSDLLLKFLPKHQIESDTIQEKGKYRILPQYIEPYKRLEELVKQIPPLSNKTLEKNGMDAVVYAHFKTINNDSHWFITEWNKDSIDFLGYADISNDFVHHSDLLLFDKESFFPTINIHAKSSIKSISIDLGWKATTLAKAVQRIIPEQAERVKRNVDDLVKSYEINGYLEQPATGNKIQHQGQVSNESTKQPESTVKPENTSIEIETALQNRVKIAPIIFGRSSEINLPNGEKHRTQYAIVEMADITASHNEHTFAPNPNFPAENDRSYHTDRNAQAIVEQVAQKLDPSMILSTSTTPEGTPIITPDGFVVSGNNRTMSLKLAASKYPERYNAYVDYLLGECWVFKNQCELIPDYGIKRPLLVRIDYDFGQYTTENMAKYNKATMKAESPTDRAVKHSIIFRENKKLFEQVAGIVGKYDTFSELYSNAREQKRIVDLLVAFGIWTQAELPQYFENSVFTAQGKEFVESILAAIVLDKESLQATALPGLKSVRNMLITSFPVLVANANLPDGASLNDALNEAILLQQKISRSGIDFADILRQLDMFSSDASKWSKKAVYLNRLLQLGKLKFKKAIEGYNQAVMNEQGGALFGDTKTPTEIFQAIIIPLISEQDRNAIENSPLVVCCAATKQGKKKEIKEEPRLAFSKQQKEKIKKVKAKDPAPASQPETLKAAKAEIDNFEKKVKELEKTWKAYQQEYKRAVPQLKKLFLTREKVEVREMDQHYTAKIKESTSNYEKLKKKAEVQEVAWKAAKIGKKAPFRKDLDKLLKQVDSAFTKLKSLETMKAQRIARIYKRNELKLKLTKKSIPSTNPEHRENKALHSLIKAEEKRGEDFTAFKAARNEYAKRFRALPQDHIRTLEKIKGAQRKFIGYIKELGSLLAIDANHFDFYQQKFEQQIEKFAAVGLLLEKPQLSELFTGDKLPALSELYKLSENLIVTQNAARSRALELRLKVYELSQNIE